MAKQKYHIVTYHPIWNGYDDKEDLNTMSEVSKAARDYLKENYDTVYVFNEFTGCLVRVFDALNKNGRKPYSFEVKQFK